MNMNTFINKNSFAAMIALFAAVLFVMPSQAYAGTEVISPDYSSDTTGYSSDTSYYYLDYSSDTSYYYPEYSSDTSYYYPEYSSDTSYSYPSYTYSTPSYNYSSGCSGCGGTGYSYTASTPSCSLNCGSSYRYPNSTYTYATPQGCDSCGGSSSYNAPTYTYIPTNTNTSTNNNNSNSSASSSSTSSVGNISNNSSSQSNSNINIVVYAGQGTNNQTNTNQSLDGYCTINPTNVSVNQDVTLSAYGTGGNGGYTYSWSGSDGLYSNAQSFTGRFSSYGSKTATVNIQSGNQSITRTCSVNVQTNQIINNNLSAYCVANPAVATVGQAVTWTVYPTGGNNYNGGYNYNNVYTYYWSGTDGLTGYGQTVSGTYSTVGTKTANVNVTSNGQSINVSCNMNVQGAVSGVTVIRQPTNGTPVSGVYLSQIPATGIDLNAKTIFFTLGLLVWSAFVAYIINTKRKAKIALAGISGNVAGFNASAMSKAEAFKMKNMSARGLVA